MSFDLTEQILIIDPHSNNDKLYGTWETLEIALDNIPYAIRKKGRLFGVCPLSPADAPVIEYQFKTGIEDADAVLYNPSPNEEDSAQIGTITTTSNSLTIGLHPSGENYYIDNGVKYAKTVAEAPKMFTAVTPGKIKYLVIEGRPDSEIFHLVEGVEGSEAVMPDYTGFFISLVTVSDIGVIVEGNDDFEYKQKSDDNWKSLVINSNTGAWVSMISPGSTIGITKSPSVIDPKIKGFTFKYGANLWGGKRLILRNETIMIVKAEVVSPLPIVAGVTYVTFKEAYNLLPNTDYWVLEREGKIELLKTTVDISGKVDKPTTDGTWAYKKLGALYSWVAIEGLNSSSLVNKMGMYWDSTAGKLISNAVEYLGDGWLKLKAITFGGYTTAQMTAWTTAPNGTQIYVTDGAKGLYLKEASGWIRIDANIGNADLTNLVIRKFTQGAGFTWDTLGNSYFLKGLTDKTTQLPFENFIVAHPITGEVGTFSPSFQADITSDINITSSTLTDDGRNQNGKIVLLKSAIASGNLAISFLQNSHPKFVASYIKMTDVSVYFNAPIGINIEFKSGMSVLNGGIGSRATVIRVSATTYFIYIYNV